MHGNVETANIYKYGLQKMESESVKKLGLKLELEGWVGYFTNHFLPKRLFFEPVAR